MRLLLDTHCWLWMQVSPGMLVTRVCSILEDPDHELLLSSGSVWEISIKWSLGKLALQRHRSRAASCVRSGEDTPLSIDVKWIMRMAVMSSVLRAKCMSATLMGGLALGLGSSAEAAAAPAKAAIGDPARFSELMARAEAYRAEGAHAKSARALTDAYAALGERDQGGVKGEITVNNAVDDFKLAQEQDPENVALLEEEAALLERFGAHAKRKGVLPAGLAEELARVKAKVDEVRAAAEAKAEEQRKADETAKAEAERKAANEEVVGIEDRPSRRKADAAIVGVGAVSVVGGVALIASGAWNIGNVRRRGDELLAAIDANEGGTPDMREALLGDIEAWRKEWRGIGTGLVVGGAVLAAAGVGLTTWGVVRMRRGKQGVGQATVVRPMLSGREVGLVVMGRW